MNIVNTWKFLCKIPTFTKHNLHRRKILGTYFIWAFIQSTILIVNQRTHASKKFYKDNEYEKYSVHSICRKLTLHKSSGNVIKM